MTQAERDRLVTLKKAQKKLITQQQAAEELKITERHVRRLLRELKRRGDKILLHGLRGLPSNRRVNSDTEQEAIMILSQPVYQGFGPTLAAEYLANKHGISVSRETVRQWMMEAGLWRSRPQRVETVHEWRPRRSRFGELVQWDTSDHDWLEGRGEDMLLINMIDDATSRWFARFVLHDSTLENMNHLERYLKRFGRALAYYTDRASLFQTAEKSRRDGSRCGKSREELPPTQIGRALQELGITWIAAYSPQAKGRVERGFLTAQDRLVKGLRVAGVTSLQGANDYLESEFLPWVNSTLAVAPAHPDDAHRPLEKQHDLDAILSHVERRRVNSDYTFPLEAKTYRILRQDVCVGLRGAYIRVEQRRDGSVAACFGGRYLRIERCEMSPKVTADLVNPTACKAPRKPVPKSRWNQQFDLKKGPTVWQAAQASGCRREES
jgi:transposase